MPPDALMIAAVSSIVSGRPYGDGLPLPLRPVQETVAPASASARAMPRPAPRVAPATRATRPASGFWDDLRLAMIAYAASVLRVLRVLRVLGVLGALKVLGVLKVRRAAASSIKLFGY